MKKILLLILIMTSFFCTAQSKKELDFKVRYKPETNYMQSVDQNTVTTIKYAGSEDFLEKLKAKGYQKPMVTNQKSTIESVLKTGKLIDKTHFPITIEFKNTPVVDGKKIIPDATIIYGKGTLETLPSLDSIVAEGMDEGFKKGFLQSMQSMFSQLSFPDQSLNIGQSFTQESPLSIPIAGTKVDMKISTTYKLLSIANGTADFDVSQVYTINTVVTGYKLDATGNGKGKMVYDIKNNYYLKYNVDTDLKMDMKVDQFSMDLSTKSSVNQTFSISKNTGK